MALTWLDDGDPFPPAHSALKEPDGLLAISASLSTARLHEAYSNGIFPWFSEGQPVLWWSPDPRMVLETAAFSPGGALRKKLARIARGALPIRVRMNTVFDQVIAQCAAPRRQQDGTWIVPAIQQVYGQWHKEGKAHSIETWVGEELVGGLYGVGLGGMFFGESMFTRETDASKIALAYLVSFLQRHGVPLIDCQQETSHLASLGARPIARAAFLDHVRQAIGQPAPPWGRGELLADGTLLT